MTASVTQLPVNSAEPTPIPELMAEIEQEGGLLPWLSARSSAARLAEYDAALEREATKRGLPASRPQLRAVR